MDDGLQALASTSTPFQPPPGFKGSAPGSGVPANARGDHHAGDEAGSAGAAADAAPAGDADAARQSAAEAYQTMFPSLPTSSAPKPAVGAAWRVRARAPGANPLATGRIWKR